MRKVGWEKSGWLTVDWKGKKAWSRATGTIVSLDFLKQRRRFTTTGMTLSLLYPSWTSQTWKSGLCLKIWVTQELDPCFMQWLLYMYLSPGRSGILWVQSASHTCSCTGISNLSLMQYQDGATQDKDGNSNLWWISTRCRWTSLHFSLIATRRYPVLRWHTHKCVGWNPEDHPEAAEGFHAWRVLWWSPRCLGDCADKTCSPDKSHMRKGVWVAGRESKSKTTFNAASPLYSGDAQEAQDRFKILSAMPTPHWAAEHVGKKQGKGGKCSGNNIS